MASLLSIAIVSLLSYYFYSQWNSLRQNLTAAKTSGLPYKIVLGGILTPTFLLPFLDRVPKSWTESWLPLLVFPRTWHAGYGPFADVGFDTFIAVSPSHNALWTCDPEAVLQISKSKNEFPKAVKSLAVLNVYGPTVTGTDGDESRLYRRITGPAFNDRTFALTWADTLEQTQVLLQGWRKSETEGLVEHLGEDAACMTLHIMSRVCFGRKMDWIDEFYNRGELLSGHTLSYSEALSSMLDNVKTIFAMPQFILKISPFQSHKKAWRAFTEWRSYMEELRTTKEKELESCGPNNSPDLLEALVRAGPSSMSSPNNFTKPTSPSPPASISSAAVLGNIFIFLLAGHETSASTLQFALTCLACHPHYQTLLQRSLDAILGERHPSSWSYHRDFPLLYKGFPGAVLAETVRLFTVLPFYLRCTNESPQNLMLQGVNHTIPPETLILINTSATHRNPKHWPQHIPEDGELPPYALSGFDPRRWLKDGDQDSLDEKALRPEPGSYVPFSAGTRACMGSRFAEIEVVAMLARIFRDWNVELVADEAGEKGWKKAREKARTKVTEGVGFVMALKMMEEVPLRLVKRGYGETKN